LAICMTRLGTGADPPRVEAEWMPQPEETRHGLIEVDS
jgi:hypothetical protein